MRNDRISNTAMSRYGRILREKYESFKNAEYELSELILKFEYYSLKVEYQIAFLRNIWSSLDEKLQLMQNTLLHALSHKLQSGVELVDAAIGGPKEHNSAYGVLRKKGDARRVKFSWSLKQCLERTVEDIAKWHQMFDPTWFLISRVPGTLVDSELQHDHASEMSSASALKQLRDAVHHGKGNNDRNKRIFLKPDFLHGRDGFVPDSTLHMGTSIGGEEVLLDTVIAHPMASPARVRKEIRQLAYTMSTVDPASFGLLKCVGVIERSLGTSEEDSSRYSGDDYTQATKKAAFGGERVEPALTFEFVFSIPKGLSHPQSLRALLSRAGERPRLNDRLFLAQHLVNAVMFVHSSDFVHKNIRPETVVLFEDSVSEIGVPFLAGFEKFRSADGQTFRTGEAVWEKDLYRHPERQGHWPEMDYSMQHDIYSLGVVLLEIGLWTSFVVSGASDASIPGPSLSIAHLLTDKNQRRKARLIKQVLLDLTEKQLPRTMGTKLTSIVLSCLTCLDKDNEGFGDLDDFLDADGILVGVRYAEHVSSSNPVRLR